MQLGWSTASDVYDSGMRPAAILSQFTVILSFLLCALAEPSGLPGLPSKIYGVNLGSWYAISGPIAGVVHLGLQACFGTMDAAPRMARHGGTALRRLFHLHWLRIVSNIRLVMVVAYNLQRVRESFPGHCGQDIQRTLVCFS
jgi:hypothetical protein